MTWDRIAWWCVGVFALWCLFALAGCALFRWFGDFDEPPGRKRKRRQLRALRGLEPLPPVIPEPRDARRGYP